MTTTRDPLEVLRELLLAQYKYMARTGKREITIGYTAADHKAAAEAIAQVEALAHEARAVLEHVESDSIPRIGGQCTLCHTFRMKLHSALDPFTPGQDSEGGRHG